MDDSDKLGEVGFGGAKPAWLSGRAKGLLDAGGIPASLVGIVLLPAHEPGLANSEGLSVVPC